MSLTEPERDRLFALLEAILATLNSCCDHLEEGLKRVAPPPSSKRRGPKS